VRSSSPNGPWGRSGNLKKQLARRKAALVHACLDKAVRAYSPETVAVLRRERDRFANPVGHALSAGIRGLVDGLLSDADAAELGLCVEPILKIRSVQDLPPSRALAFVLVLKEVIREQLGDTLRSPGITEEWDELEGRLDQLALLAFDLFTRWREQVQEIRVRDLKRNVAVHLRRLELAEDDDAEGAARVAGPGS
jgi:hypothetical protein